MEKQTQGFQYFSSVPVLHYLQAVHFIKIWSLLMNIIKQHSLKLGTILNWLKYLVPPLIKRPVDTIDWNDASFCSSSVNSTVCTGRAWYHCFVTGNQSSKPIQFVLEELDIIVLLQEIRVLNQYCLSWKSLTCLHTTRTRLYCTTCLI